MNNDFRFVAIEMHYKFNAILQSNSSDEKGARAAGGQLTAPECAALNGFIQ
jgi:hypothetical protein